LSSRERVGRLSDNGLELGLTPMREAEASSG
jgi:hypothetical protein